MILTCPACRTRFLIADAVFGTSARTVRCGSCKHEWVAEPAGAAPAEKLADSVVDDFVATRQRQLDARAARAAPGSRKNLPVVAGQRFSPALLRRLKTALLVLALALGGITLGIYGQHMLPKAAAWFYGTGAASTGLVLENISTRYEPLEVDGIKSWQLIIDGSIKNNTSTALAVPPVQITLLDAAGATLMTLDASVQLTELAAGAVTSFVQTVDAVPATIASATVGFAAPSVE